MRTLDTAEFDNLKRDITEHLGIDPDWERSAKQISRAVCQSAKRVGLALTQLMLDDVATERHCPLNGCTVYKLAEKGLRSLMSESGEDEETNANTVFTWPSLKFLQAPLALAFAWTDQETYDEEKEVVAWGFQHHRPEDQESKLLVTDAKSSQVLGWFTDVADVLEFLKQDEPDEFGRRLITVYVGQPTDELRQQLRERRDAPTPASVARAGDADD